MKAAVSNQTSLNTRDLRDRMMSCWLGKAIGGTLGMPFEGVRHTLSLSYYDPVPTEMLPNDDLDLQVIYACMLDRMTEPQIDRLVLAEAWRHVGMSCDEYGVVKRNLRLGLRPPDTGRYDNPFALGMGAAIRTELWACLAAGNPDLAARYAYEDACMDHADEGIEAAVFLAALQAMAFVVQDRDELIARSMAFLPSSSCLRRALGDTLVLWQRHRDWRSVQAEIARRYLNDNFTDVVINLAYILLGWLASDDFGEAICIAVSCGQDTDCTGATLGATLGIIDPRSIDERWLKPIGRDLVLSPSVHGIQPPPTLDAFNDLVLDLRRRLGGRAPEVQATYADTTSLGIPVQLGTIRGDVRNLRHADAVAADVERAMLPGTWAKLPSTERGASRVVRYRLKLRADQSGHLMVCSATPVRAWWDGRLVIDSAGGAFVPAFHRCLPADGIRPLLLTRGPHELLAALGASETTDVSWVVGLCDDPDAPGCRSWIDDPFERGGAA
jgi:ADP-ribosylglycohydrolase